MPDHDLTSDLPGPSTGLGSRALRNTILVLTAKVIARLIALVTVLAMIKYLKAASYGGFATVVNYTAIVSVVLDLGFNVLFVREGARHPGDIQRYLRNVMSVRLLMSVVSLGSLTGALATARRRTIDVRVVSRNAAIFGVALALLTFTPNQPSAFAVGFLVGLGSITFMTAATAITQLAADPSMRGRVLALQAIVFLGSTPVGGPIVGAISETFGARYAIALGALATMAASGFGFFTIRRSRKVVLTHDAAPIPLQTDVPGDLALLDPLVTPKAS